MENDKPAKPKEWRGIAGWALLIAGVLERIVGWGGSIDFLISRSRDPSWVGDIANLALQNTGVILILIGVAFIVWNERRRTARLLEQWIPLGPKADATEAGPAVRRLNAVVRLEDLAKFRAAFSRSVGAIGSTTIAIKIIFDSYAERVERYSRRDDLPKSAGTVRHPIDTIQEFMQNWDQDVEAIVAKTMENLGENYTLVFDPPRLDVSCGSEPEGLDMNALLRFRAFKSRSANFTAWSERVRDAIPAEIEHLNAVRRGEA